MKRAFAIIALIASLTIFTQASDDNFTLTTTDGKSIHAIGAEDGLTIEEYKGKIVFLEFFGHKCPPCLKMIGRYTKLKDKYKDKIAIIAIEVQGLSDGQLKSFAKTKGINYVTISQDKAGHFVEYISTRSQWQGSIPYLIILDKKGVVQLIHAGALSDESLDMAVVELSK